MTLHVLRADSSHSDLVIDLVGEAFHAVPAVQWLVVNPVHRAVVLPAYLRIQVEHAMRFGEVHITSDRAAAAVWLPHDRPQRQPDSYPTRLALACGQWVDRFHAVENLFTVRRPPGPYHHLVMLAVRPDRQGQHHASALLAHHHRQLDERGLAAYLQASDAAVRDLYRRHGYQPCGDPVTLPDGTPLWPMVRRPLSPVRPSVPAAAGFP